jgi:hypothetical protein
VVGHHLKRRDDARGVVTDRKAHTLPTRIDPQIPHPPIVRMIGAATPRR